MGKRSSPGQSEDEARGSCASSIEPSDGRDGLPRSPSPPTLKSRGFHVPYPWEYVVGDDDKADEPYYFNTVEERSQYEYPEAFSGRPESPESPWRVKTHPDDDSAYYYENRDTGVTQWTRPDAGSAQASKKASKAGHSASRQEPTEGSEAASPSASSVVRGNPQDAEKANEGCEVVADAAAVDDVSDLHRASQPEAMFQVAPLAAVEAEGVGAHDGDSAGGDASADITQADAAAGSPDSAVTGATATGDVASDAVGDQGSEKDKSSAAGTDPTGDKVDTSEKPSDGHKENEEIPVKEEGDSHTEASQMIALLGQAFAEQGEDLDDEPELPDPGTLVAEDDPYVNA